MRAACSTPSACPSCASGSRSPRSSSALYRLRLVPARAGRRHARAERLLRRGAGGNSLFGLLNIFSGGALANLSLFALGIMPYITASIILQLMTVVVPSLEKLQKEGEAGYKKITQYTRYLTVVLAALQSAGYVFLFHNGLPRLDRQPAAGPHRRAASS